MLARNHEAITIARFLVDKIFTIFGVPRQLLSDRGAEFEGRPFYNNLAIYNFSL